MLGHNQFDQTFSNFDKTFNKQLGLFEWFFKGFFIFWIIGALASIGLTVGLIILVWKLVIHFS